MSLPQCCPSSRTRSDPQSVRSSVLDSYTCYTGRASQSCPLLIEAAMFPELVVGRILHRFLYVVVCLAALATGVARAQEAPPPAYIALVEGAATLEREGEVTPAVVNMPLIPGDRVRTTAGRVEIRFPDGTGIEVAEDSAVELITPTRVRLLPGTLDRLQLF